MNIELKDIKDIRKKFGLTQSELADRAQVSQSLIAKVEAGKLDPTYTKAKKIFDTLNELSKKKEIKAEEIMTPKVIHVSLSETTEEAIKKMKKHNISQMPVIEDHKSIGLVSEASILNAMLNNKAKKTVSDIMDDSPPIVSKNTGVTAISGLLKFFPMVLVSESGKIKGVITRSDLLAKIYNV